MDPKTILAEVETRLNEHPEALQGFEALYALKLSGPQGGDYYVRILDGRAALMMSPPDDKPNATVRIADDDFVALAERRASGMSLFMEGKIQVEGDLGIALRLEGLLRS